MAGLRAACPCLRKPDPEVTVLDYRHCSLEHIPSEVFNCERTLEELYVDANQIRDLPRELFYCHGMRKLSLNDNELTSIPPAIASLINLESLDISKNGIVNLPDSIKGCKYLSCIEASVNPLGKLPEGFTQLLNLTELYLNDTFLDYLPGSFGRLTRLRILEVRENHLKTLPKSIARLTQLERIDIGNNEFTQLPDVIGSLSNLLELWCDCNQITHLPAEIGNLKQLMFLDGSKNRIEWLPPEIDGCTSLADLHLSTNLLQQLPDSIGRLNNLTTLKVDDNRLTSLPFTLGGLVSLSELNVSANDLEELPTSIGFLRHLRTLYADENFIYDVPTELGSCNGLTVLSLRSNNLMYIPDEIGRIPRLRVLNLSDNKIRALPYSITRLKELQALWLSENQTKPLIRLQPDIDIDTGKRVLTCYLLPQQANDHDEMYSDADSFHPSLWEEERHRRQKIHFDFDGNSDDEGKLERHPTPYPKEMKNRMQHMRNLALKQLNITVPNGDVRPKDATQVAPPNPESKGESTPLTTSVTSPTSSSATTTTAVSAGPGPEEELSRLTTPRSPLHERHMLLKADKERNLRDKARINRPSQSHEDLLALTPSKDKPGRTSREVTPENAKKGKDKSLPQEQVRGGLQSPDDDDGGFLQPLSRRPRSIGSNMDVSGQVSKPSSVMDLNANLSHTDGQHRPAPNANPPGSYRDFMKGLHGGPVQGGPMQGGPMQGGPMQGGPMPGGPMQGGPMHGGPMPIGPDHVPNYKPVSTVTQYHMRPILPHASHHTRRGRGYDSDTGYRSDQEAYRHRQPLGPARDGGYASDWEAVLAQKNSAQQRRRDGYSSDQELYASHRNQKFRPISVQPMYSTIHEQQTAASRVPPEESVRQRPPTYSNVPYSKRTTIRNDEMYEQYKSASVKGTQAQSVHDTSRNSDVPTSQTPSVNQSRTGSILNVKDGTDTGNSDDDMWRAQLYQASVKLQKTPSDKRKNRPPLCLHLSEVPPNSALTTARSRMPLMLSSNEGHGESVFSPPPYQPAPPYGTARSNHEASYQDTTELPRQHSDNHSMQSNSEESPHKSDNRDSPRPNTLPLGLPESPSHQTFEKPSSEGNMHERSALLQRTNINNSQAEIMETSLKRSSSLNVGLTVNVGQHDSGMLPPGYPPGAYTTPQGAAPPYFHPTSRTSSSHLSTPLDSPLRLTQYEKDVAMYKQNEPPSQVSSSTDSGYGHTNIYERMQDHSRLPDGTSPQGQSPSSPHLSIYTGPPPQYRSSPSRDSAIASLSRESTPGTVASPGSSATENLHHDLSSESSPRKTEILHVMVTKNPGLGFSIAGGLGSQGNPFRPQDTGIFITKVQPNGPAANILRTGDKILEVNSASFVNLDHQVAVNILRSTSQSVSILIERQS